MISYRDKISIHQQMLSTVTRTVSLTLNLELMFSFIVEQNVRDELSGSIYLYNIAKKGQKSICETSTAREYNQAKQNN